MKTKTKRDGEEKRGIRLKKDYIKVKEANNNSNTQMFMIFNIKMIIVSGLVIRVTKDKETRVK